MAMASIVALTASNTAAQETPPSAPPEAPETQLDMSRRLSLVEAQIRAAGGQPVAPLRLERVRLLFSLSVAQEAYIEIARDEIARLEQSHDSLFAVLEAHRGALDVVEGKHAFWPHSKVSHVRRGLHRLDALVAQHPNEPEIRFLRLVGCYFLPFFFGRGDTAQEDIRALAQLLPETQGTFSEAAFQATVDFLLDYGDLPSDQEKVLLEAAASVQSDDRGGALTHLLTPPDTATLQADDPAHRDGDPQEAGVSGSLSRAGPHE